MKEDVNSVLLQLNNDETNIANLTEEDYQTIKNRFNEISFKIIEDAYSPLNVGYTQSGDFSCNEGGCIRVGENITIRNETRKLCSFYSKAFNNNYGYNDYTDKYLFYVTIIPDEGYQISSIKRYSSGWIDMGLEQTSFNSDEIGGYDLQVSFQKIVNEEWLAELQQIREEAQTNLEKIDSLLALGDWVKINCNELEEVRYRTNTLLNNISTIEGKVYSGEATQEEIGVIKGEWNGLSWYCYYINPLELTITSQGGGSVEYFYDEYHFIDEVRNVTRHIRYLFPKPYSMLLFEIIPDDGYIVDSIVVNGNRREQTSFYSYEISGELVVAFKPTELPLLTLTAESYTREYGEENPEFGYSASIDGIAGSPQITCYATAQSYVGTYPIVISKGSVDYENVSLVDGTLTITEAPLTITAENKWMRQGEAAPVLTARYDGFKLNETESVLTVKPQLQTTATTTSPMGEYNITVSDAQAHNYAPSYANGTLTIIGRRGDVNRDSYVNVRDLADIIQYLLEKPNVDVKTVYDADLDNNLQVTSTDVESVVGCIMGNDQAPSRSDTPSAEGSAQLNISQKSDRYLSISLQNSMPIVAFQFDVLLPEGTNLSEVLLTDSRCHDHDIAWRQTTNGHYRVLAYSMPMNSLRGNSGEIAELKLTGVGSDVTLTNIHVTDDSGNDYALPCVTLNLVTDISTLTEETTFDVYDLNGRLVRHSTTSTKGLHRGVYIINYKKVVIK